MKIDDLDELALIGDHHESIPALLITDPDLNSNDKILWQVLRLSIQRGNSRTSMPSQVDLADIMRITKRSVVTSIHALRITRWLTIRHRFDAHGKIQRNLYGIHSRPGRVEDAITLDSDYPGYVVEVSKNSVDRIRALAMAAIRTLQDYPEYAPSRILADQIEYDAALEAYHPGQRQSGATLHKNKPKLPISELTLHNHQTGHTVATPKIAIFGRKPVVFGSSMVQEIGKNGENTSSEIISPPDSTPKAGSEIISPPESTTSSSNYINTTTHYPTKELPEDFHENEDLLKLTPREKDSLLLHLNKSIPVSDRQAFWDEFTIIVATKAQSPQPIQNKVHYFLGLVKRYVNGSFNFTGAHDRMAERRATQAAVRDAHIESENRILAQADMNSGTNRSKRSVKPPGWEQKIQEMREITKK